MAKRKGKPSPGDSEKAPEPFGAIQHRKKRAMLTAYCQTGNISRAAEAAQVDRSSHWHWMKDPAYAAAFGEAQRIATTLLEDEAHRRAVQGLVRKKFTKDGAAILDPATGQHYTELEYSDTLLIFLMKGNNPEKYRERTETKHTGEVTTKHEVKIIPSPSIARIGGP